MSDELWDLCDSSIVVGQSWRTWINTWNLSSKGWYWTNNNAKQNIPMRIFHGLDCIMHQDRGHIKQNKCYRPESLRKIAGFYALWITNKHLHRKKRIHWFAHQAKQLNAAAISKRFMKFDPGMHMGQWTAPLLFPNMDSRLFIRLIVCWTVRNKLWWDVNWNSKFPWSTGHLKNKA